jgi:hypothetical protein
LRSQLWKADAPFFWLLAVKARATIPRGRETIEGMIDNAIELWTRMAIADSERDAKVRAQVTQVQENSKKYVAEIMRIHGMKKDLYFRRHNDALGLKDHFDSLDGSLQSAQVETARLTLALKEAEGEAEELRTQRDQLQQELAQARDALEGMHKSAADAASELAGLRDRGLGDSEQIAKLKRELSMEQGCSKELLKEKNELLAQIDRLNRTVAESRQEVSLCLVQQPSFRCEHVIDSFFSAMPVFLPGVLKWESSCFALSRSSRRPLRMPRWLKAPTARSSRRQSQPCLKCRPTSSLASPFLKLRPRNWR